MLTLTKLKHMLPYLAVIAADFYLAPLLIQDTGSAMMLLMLIIPLVCFAASVWYGVRHRFSPYFVLIVGILFAPTIFMFYNYTAWIYIIWYLISALTGNLIGTAFNKKTAK